MPGRPPADLGIGGLQATAGNRAVVDFIAAGRAAPQLTVARQVGTADPAAPAGASTSATAAPAQDLAPADRPQLSLGSSGEWVTALQTKLRGTRGRTGLAVSGTFDGPTRQAVVEVQQLMGQKADGIVGPKTWEVLDNISGGAAFDADAFKILHDKAVAAVGLEDAGQFGPALAAFREVYADPNMTAKPDLRTSITIEMGRCEHGLGNFAAAIGRYQEGASAPGATSFDKMMASELTREASLGKPPSSRADIEQRSHQPQPA